MTFATTTKSLALLGTLCSAVSSQADVLLQESFQYNDGVALDSREGGTGFKAPWSGDSEPTIRERSYGYTDSKGNVFTTTGRSVVGTNSDKKIVRDTEFSVGNEVWAAFGLDASPGGTVNVSIDEKVFFGQGNLSSGTTNWGISDSSGQLDSSGVAADGSAFLVSRMTVDGDGKIERVWAWLNPVLDITPNLSDSFTGAGGRNVGGLGTTFSKITIALENGNGGGESFISEIRLGQSFADIAPFTAAAPVPEPAHWLLIGLGLLAAVGPRWRRQSARV